MWGLAAVRLNLYWRGVDIIDVELHAGSKGLYVDLNVFKPRQGEEAPDEGAKAATADLSGTASGSYERIDGPVWADDAPAVVRAQQGFGFGRSAR